MSSKIVSNSNKFYCKVCQDAGKPESVFRSHFTRESKDPNSKVCCPTLLALECRYCFKQGHTVKYCKVLKTNEKKKLWSQQKTIEAPILKKEEKKSIMNKFAYLDDSEDEDEEVINVETKVSEDFPQLCAVPFKQTINISQNGYADALNKTPVALPESIPVRIAPLTKKKKLSVLEINWASLDSDSEEEDEDYEHAFNEMNDYETIHNNNGANVYSDDW